LLQTLGKVANLSVTFDESRTPFTSDMGFPKKSQTKTIVGGLIWIAAIVGVSTLLLSRMRDSSVLKRLSGYFGKPTKSVELVADRYQMLGFGDPIFLIEGDEATQIGNVAYIDFGEGYEGFRLGDTKQVLGKRIRTS